MEASVSIIEAGLGAILPPYSITLLDGTLYVATWKDTNRQNYNPPTYQQGKGVVPLNPGTLVFGAAIGALWTQFGPTLPDAYTGPRDILAASSRLHMPWFSYSTEPFWNLCSFDPLNVADNPRESVYEKVERSMQADTDGTSIYTVSTYYETIDRYNHATHNDDYVSFNIANHQPYGVVWCPADNKAYAFGANSKLLAVSDFVSVPGRGGHWGDHAPTIYYYAKAQEESEKGRNT